MKKPMLISLSLLTAASFSAALVSATTSTNFLFSKADGNSTKITLNNSRKPDIVGKNASLLWNQSTTLAYKNVTAYDGGHVELLPGGSIVKDNALKKDNVSNGLLSITATFEGDLKVQTSYKEGEIDYVYTLESGVEEPIAGNYFKILTYDGAKIDNLELSFGCVPSAFVDDGNKYKDQLDEYKIVNPNGTGNDAFMSINAFNSNYKSLGVSANVVDVDGEHCELYIITEENRLTKFENCLATLDFSSSSLTGYEKVVVTGGGELAFIVQNGDGMKCNDFVVEYGTTLKLSRSATGGSGVSPWENLDIYGKLDISNFNHGIALNQSGSGTSISVDIKKSGLLSIHDCATSGFTAWNKASSTETTTVNIEGTTEINGPKNGFKNSGSADIFTVNIIGNLTINCSENGINGENKFPLNFKDQSVTTITTDGEDKSGIYMANGCPTFGEYSTINIKSNNGYGIYIKDSHSTFIDHTTVNITAKFGIYHNNGLRVTFKNYSTVNINCTKTGIKGAQRILFYDDGDENKTVNHASLSVKSSGGNPIEMQSENHTHFIFYTLGSINIENTSGTRSYTGIHFGDKVTSTCEFKIKCANLTFKNLSNCWGKWMTCNVTTEYVHDENGFNKIKLINCGNIYNSGYSNSTQFSKFTENTVDRETA